MIRPEDQEPCIEGLEYYLDAFRELSTCRNNGMEISAIPFTAIVEYFTIFGVGDFDEFLYVIRRMDNKVLELADSKKAKTKNSGGPSGTTKSNPNNPGNSGRKGKPSP